MMLGKQRFGRPSATASRQQQQQQHRHMRRTTSMTEFAAPEDVLADVVEEEDEAELQLMPAHAEAEAEPEADPYGWTIIGGASAAGRADDWLATTYRARAAPKKLAGLRRNSADFSAAETAAFLRACGLCNRRLGPGRDTFMYRGDTAFCSLECRQQHITIEEWKDKCALATPPTAPASDPVTPLPPSGAGSDKPGTLTAAS